MVIISVFLAVVCSKSARWIEIRTYMMPTKPIITFAT